MTKRIITISREFGSGGHTIGKAVAERMGVSFYDSQLISKVAKQSGLSEEFIRDNEEYASHANSFLYQIAMSAAGSYGYPSIYQKLYEAQTHVIEELAEKEACIIMGRCSDYIAHRAKHVLERYGATEKPVEQRLKEMDNRRRNYYRFHTDRDWGVCNNYHLALDSGLLGEEKCVELILDAADFKCR